MASSTNDKAEADSIRCDKLRDELHFVLPFSSSHSLTFSLKFDFKGLERPVENTSEGFAATN